jgi:phage FluMu protein Com
MQEAQKNLISNYKCQFCEKGQVVVNGETIRCPRCHGLFQIKIVPEEEANKYFR